MPDSGVLVVDDDDEIRETLRTLFADEGYTVHTALHGREALVALLEAEQPQVVLLDLLMPGMTGDQLLRVVAGAPNLRMRHAYIILTAFQEAVTPDVRHLLDNLHVPLMFKPFDTDALLGVVAEAASRLEQQNG